MKPAKKKKKSPAKTGTERKREWRARSPEKSREAERKRALARRRGHWGSLELGVVPRPCESSDSYWRYEATMKRFKQRIFWPRYGAGTTKLSPEEFRERSAAIFTERAAALGVSPEQWEVIHAYRTDGGEVTPEQFIAALTTKLLDETGEVLS